MSVKKNLIVTGLIAAAMYAAPAKADDRSCFSQKTGDGYVRICNERDGDISLNLRTNGDRDQRRDYAWADHRDEYRARQKWTRLHHGPYEPDPVYCPAAYHSHGKKQKVVYVPYHYMPYPPAYGVRR